MTTPNFTIEELPSAEVRRKGAWYHVRTFCRRYPLGAVGAAITILFVFAAVFAEFVTGMDPYSTNAASSLAAPGAEHLLGADVMGRDMFSRIVYGARISLIVGVGSTFVGCLFGVIIGLAISIPLIPNVARIIRSNTMSLREMPFVESARASGMSEWRIAIRHVLPNTLAPLIVLSTAQLGAAILTEASLSFLGLGIPEPHASWGRMLSESAAEYVRTAPWLVIFPGLAISLVVFGTNLLGDAVRDMLDPRQRKT